YHRVRFFRMRGDLKMAPTTQFFEIVRPIPNGWQSSQILELVNAPTPLPESFAWLRVHARSIERPADESPRAVINVAEMIAADRAANQPPPRPPVHEYLDDGQVMRIFGLSLEQLQYACSRMNFPQCHICTEPGVLIGSEQKFLRRRLEIEQWF